MVLDGIISLLAQDAGVAALVGGRIYLSVLPRGYALPALAIHRYGGSQDYEMSGPVPVNDDLIQVDVYGETAASCQSVEAAVRLVLDAYTGALPEGTVVQACYRQRRMDMPFLAHADAKSVANRSTLGYRVVTVGTVITPPLPSAPPGRSAPWGLRTLTGAMDGTNKVFVSDVLLAVATTLVYLNGLLTLDWSLGADSVTITIGAGSPAPGELEVYG